MSLAGHAEPKILARFLRPKGEGLKNAESSGCRKAEPGLLSKARGWQNEDLFAQIPRCKDVSKSRAFYPCTILGDMSCGNELRSLCI